MRINFEVMWFDIFVKFYYIFSFKYFDKIVYKVIIKEIFIICIGFLIV